MEKTCVELCLIAGINLVVKITSSDCDKHSDVLSVHNLVNNYSDVFEGSGKIKIQAKIYVDSEVEPCVDRPHTTFLMPS